MLGPCSPVQGFGSWRRGVEVCGCGGGCCCDFDFVGVLYGVCNLIICWTIEIDNPCPVRWITPTCAELR